MSEEREALGTDLAVDMISPEELREAAEMGWADKDKWRGKPEEWLPAKEFLERGRNVLPIVTATNRRLKEQLAQQEAALQRTSAEVKALKAGMEALGEQQLEDNKVAIEDKRKQLKADLVAASRDGDHERVAELTDEIAQLRQPEEPAQPRRVEQPNQPNPAIVSWFARHEDIAKDHRRIAMMRVVAEEKRSKGDMRVGGEFMDEVLEEVEGIFSGGNGSGQPSRVSGGNGGRGRQQNLGGGKSYADLPAEAKQACDRMAARVVGEGKKHKDLASWRKSYTTQYFSE